MKKTRGKKLPYVCAALYKKAKNMIFLMSQGNPRKAIQTNSRRSIILSNFIGLHFLVHNGKKYMDLEITKQMVGYKLGEFVPTRKFTGHKGVNKGGKKK